MLMNKHSHLEMQSVVSWHVGVTQHDRDTQLQINIEKTQYW